MSKYSISTAIITALFGLLPLQNLSAQHSTFFDADDARGRGYTERPYLRYEAEPNEVAGFQGSFLSATFDQRTVQSEASNQQAIQLDNVGDYVQWTNDEAADGMTIRFSIPDNTAGTGTIGKLNLYVDGVLVEEIELNSFWAWQYFLESIGSSYPDNTAATNKFARMRFDETRVKLANKIPAGATFKLEKADAGAGAYTIDFVELEPIPEKVAAPEGAIIYSGDGSDLASVLSTSENLGKTIYVPEGKYEVPVRLFIFGNGAKLIGAGMWYTQLHFTASPTGTLNAPNSPNSYAARGIESGSSNVELSGFYITTENNRRYASYYDSNYQVGKGLNGSFGTNSKISDVWITHFECGGWIEGANGLQISHSRFRNNYADGINLSRGSQNTIVEQCSFRNNGDDDMASWSRDNQATVNNSYQYNTSENCWRAAAIGFFGGRQNKALNCVIIDPIECGIRYNNDFDGAPFSSEGNFEIRDISIYRAGNKPGTRGQSGDLWGGRTAAIFLNSSAARYDVKNAVFSDIDIYDSKGDAILMQSRSKSLVGIQLENVNVNTINVSDVGSVEDYYGLRFNNAQGTNNFFCVKFENVPDDKRINQTPPVGFFVTSDCNTITRMMRVNETLDLLPLVPENFSNNLDFSIIDGTDIITLNTGIVSAENEGIAQIKITDLNNEDNTVTVTIAISEVALLGVSLPETLQMTYRDQYKLIPDFITPNATNQQVTWTTTDATTVSVTVAGWLAARKVGSAVITVKTEEGGYTASCVVTVVEKDLSVGDVTKDGCKVIGYFNLLGQPLKDAPENGAYIETYENCKPAKFVK
jgi:hypothetical protein